MAFFGLQAIYITSLLFGAIFVFFILREIRKVVRNRRSLRKAEKESFDKIANEEKQKAERAKMLKELEDRRQAMKVKSGK